MSSNSKKLDGSISVNINKMRIKAFPTSVNDNYVVKIWETLKKAIIEIQKKNNSGLSFEELYRNAYTMVLQKHGEQLYNGTKQVVTEHLQKIKDQVVENLNNNFLTYLNQCWKDHHTAMVMIRDILMYMDRVYVAQTEKQNVYNAGLIIFRDTLLRFTPIRDNLQSHLLSMVARERKGEVIAKSQIRDACQMLVQLGVNSTLIYEEDFEKVFLEQSREFYKYESDKFLSENSSAILYIKRVEQRIEEESKRARHYLDPSTEPKIVKVLEEELISAHLNEIVNMINSGLSHMLHQKLHSNISSMYKLLNRVDNGLPMMSQCVSAFLRDQGRAIVSDETKSPLAYIAELLTLRDKGTTLLLEALDNHTLFRNQINTDFEYFINHNPRSPEYLSIFIDEKLRRGTKGLDDPEIDAVFDKCIVLFRYLQDKDVFERYYKQHLAKRLLTMKSQSDDQEKSMISKLIVECGGVFTSKLEGMFKDMAVSKTLMEEWINSVKQNNFGIDLYVRVLTTGLWPTQSLNINVILSEEARLSFDAYSKFYLSKHNGRVINLQPNLGSVELSAVFNGAQSPVSSAAAVSPTLQPVATSSSNSGPGAILIEDAGASRDSSGSFGSQVSQTGGDAVTSANRASSVNSHLAITSTKKYILQVSTYQMIILMKFNKKNKFTFEELVKETNIPEKDLIRSLLSMSLNKSTQKILIKEPKPKSTDIVPSDTFTINDGFTSKHYKVKIQNITIKETEPERKETKTRVDENRKYVIEATIVRIMKARKTLTHNLLIAEVTEQLKSRFLPNPQMIKQRIESLLERDYLARSEDDKKIYRYQA